MSEDKKTMWRLHILKWALVIILMLCLADIGGYAILGMVGKIKTDWFTALEDVVYLLIWPTIMRLTWQIDKDER